MFKLLTIVFFGISNLALAHNLTLTFTTPERVARSFKVYLYENGVKPDSPQQTRTYYDFLSGLTELCDSDKPIEFRDFKFNETGLPFREGAIDCTARANFHFVRLYFSPTKGPPCKVGGDTFGEYSVIKAEPRHGGIDLSRGEGRCFDSVEDIIKWHCKKDAALAGHDRNSLKNVSELGEIGTIFCASKEFQLYPGSLVNTVEITE